MTSTRQILAEQADAAFAAEREAAEKRAADATAISAAPDTLTHVERINGARFPQEDSAMSPEQFEALKALLIEYLSPGRELSELYLTEYKARMAAAAAPAPAATGTIGRFTSMAEAQGAVGDRQIEIVAHEDGSFSVPELAPATV